MTECFSSRRGFLRSASKGSLALAGTLGVGTLTACSKPATPEATSEASPPRPLAKGASTPSVRTTCSSVSQDAALRYPFYAPHQAGIVTPAQRHIYFLVLDLHSSDIGQIRQMYQDWTQMAARLTQGHHAISISTHGYVPPVDTGEADSLSSYGLTLTFGVSASCLIKLGLQRFAPPELRDLPKFARDQIKTQWSGGDICIQSCSHDPQVAFHAVRQLVRHARSVVTMRWSQAGFNAYDDIKDTPRNLFGFKDGTANTEALQNAKQHLWAQGPAWLQGGSYLVARKIKMHLETWDRTSLRGQEETFGRKKDSGAPMGQPELNEEHAPVQLDKIPEISHVHLSKKPGTQILRRSYSFASGIDSRTGQFDAGLLFISYQKSPAQFIAIQSSLGRIDKMNEYVTHVGSGLFACFSGVREGQYLGQALWDKSA